MCSKCGVEKLLDEFPLRPDQPGRRYSACRSCKRDYVRAHYAANVPYYTDKAARARQLLRSQNYVHLIRYLCRHPCLDCGESDVRVLQFDHTDPTTKEDNVSRLVMNSAWVRVLDEIRKCVVRCANCHRIKTAERRAAATLIHTTELRENSVEYAA